MIIRRPAATARSTCSKPRVSTTPPGSKTRMFRRCGYSAATRPRLSLRADDNARDLGLGKLMLRRACFDTLRKGPIRRASAPLRLEAEPSGKNPNMPQNRRCPRTADDQRTRGAVAADSRRGVIGRADMIPPATVIELAFLRHNLLVSCIISVLGPDQPRPKELVPVNGSKAILPGLPAVAGKPVHVCLLSSIAAYTVSQGFGWHVCTRHDLGSI